MHRDKQKLEAATLQHAPGSKLRARGVGLHLKKRRRSEKRPSYCCGHTHHGAHVGLLASHLPGGFHARVKLLPLVKNTTLVAFPIKTLDGIKLENLGLTRPPSQWQGLLDNSVPEGALGRLPNTVPRRPLQPQEGNLTFLLSSVAQSLLPCLVSPVFLLLSCLFCLPSRLSS